MAHHVRHHGGVTSKVTALTGDQTLSAARACTSNR